MPRLVLSLVLFLCSVSSAAAQHHVFVVRHAERADAGVSGSPMMKTDPELSDSGKARAASLASMLKDAKITAIYTTEYRRTQQTADPLARALGLQPTVVAAKDLNALVEQVRAAKGNVLVVGHSNTVGDVIAGLGATEKVTLDDTDYDNLFIVTRGDKATVVRLHFR